MNKILNFIKNFYSQNGEDGVLEYILNTLSKNNVKKNSVRVLCLGQKFFIVSGV